MDKKELSINEVIRSIEFFDKYGIEITPDINNDELKKVKREISRKANNVDIMLIHEETRAYNILQRVLSSKNSKKILEKAIQLNKKNHESDIEQKDEYSESSMEQKDGYIVENEVNNVEEMNNSENIQEDTQYSREAIMIEVAKAMYIFETLKGEKFLNMDDNSSIYTTKNLKKLKNRILRSKKYPLSLEDISNIEKAYNLLIEVIITDIELLKESNELKKQMMGQDIEEKQELESEIQTDEVIEGTVNFILEDMPETNELSFEEEMLMQEKSREQNSEEYKEDEENKEYKETEEFTSEENEQSFENNFEEVLRSVTYKDDKTGNEVRIIEIDKYSQNIKISENIDIPVEHIDFENENIKNYLIIKILKDKQIIMVDFVYGDLNLNELNVDRELFEKYLTKVFSNENLKERFGFLPTTFDINTGVPIYDKLELKAVMDKKLQSANKIQKTNIFNVKTEDIFSESRSECNSEVSKEKDKSEDIYKELSKQYSKKGVWRSLKESLQSMKDFATRNVDEYDRRKEEKDKYKKFADTVRAYNSSNIENEIRNSYDENKKDESEIKEDDFQEKGEKTYKTESNIMCYKSGYIIIGDQVYTKYNYTMREVKSVDGKIEDGSGKMSKMTSFIVLEPEEIIMSKDDKVKQEFLEKICVPSRLKEISKNEWPYLGAFDLDGKIQSNNDVEKLFLELNEEFERGDK